MGNYQLRSFLIYFLLQALLQCEPVETTSLEVVVEGDRSEINCRTNSSYGVDWLFINATSNYEVTPEGLVPKKFISDYEVSSTNESSYKIFYLSIKRTKVWHVGTYRCRQGEDQRILTSVQLVLLTFPKCELDSSSNFTICKSTSVGNISSHSEWIGNFCTNSTPTKCISTTEENVSCEFPINGRNRTFLPFAPNITSHKLNVCEIRCIYSELTSDVDFQNTNVNISAGFSVFLNCSMKPFSSTTTKRPQDEIGQKLLLYGSIAAAVSVVLLAIIFIAIFRDKGACCAMTVQGGNNNNNSTDNGGTNYVESYYHELECLESPYSEISEVFLDNNSAYNSVATENPVADNRRFSTVPASCSPAGSPLQLENSNLLPKVTHDEARAMGCSEYAVPYVSLPIPKYATVNDRPTLGQPGRPKEGPSDNLR